MPYIAPEVVLEAKKMDLLTYLQNYEPQELVHFGGNTYCTREHDSLKISNGKWYWFSRGFGGRSALDYLIKVREMSFLEAVEKITGRTAVVPPVFAIQKKKEKKALLLPVASPSADGVIQYLTGRGIDNNLIRFCLSTGRLYESLPYHNAVFIGMESPDMPVCEEPAQTLREKRPEAIRGFRSVFRQKAKAIPCIFLRVPLTCCPTPRSERKKGWTGTQIQIICSPLPGCTAHERNCRKAHFR